MVGRLTLSAATVLGWRLEVRSTGTIIAGTWVACTAVPDLAPFVPPDPNTLPRS